MRNLRINTLTSSIALALCLLISIPVEAQSRRSGSIKTEQNRNNNSGSKKNNTNNNNGRRPNINTGNHNNKVNNPSKPDNKKQPGYNSRPPKPTNSKPANNKPNGHVQHKPPVKPHYHQHVAPPARPHRPHYRPMPRITPPPYWRPHHNAPRINGVLGLTFGTLYNITLDYLYSYNFDVDGFTNNIVYLRNVPQMNYRWQDVMLNYSAGRLHSVQFVNSTGYYDTGRYNNVYQQLCRLYGAPISSRSSTYNQHECVWYGGHSQGMVSLEYYNYNGRYYTTLTFGS